MFLHRNFCRLCLTDYSAPPFMAAGGFPRGFPLSVMMSLHFLLMLHLLQVSRPIMAFPAKLSSCACAINPDRSLRLSFLLKLSKGNIYTLLSSFLLSISYAFVHTFQVSMQRACHVIFCSFIPMSLYTHVCTSKSSSIIADGGLDI